MKKIRPDMPKRPPRIYSGCVTTQVTESIAPGLQAKATLARGKSK